MTNLLNRLPSKFGLPILCGYQNQTPTIQIVRITNIPDWYFERVVFPREQLVFEALPEAVLEIFSSNEGDPCLGEVLLCSRLRVEQTAFLDLIPQYNT